MTSPRFSVGQRVRIKSHPQLSHPHLAGEITTVCEVIGRDSQGQWRYGILLPPGSGARTAEEFALEPLYDGDQPASWTDCVWKPEGVRC